MTRGLEVVPPDARRVLRALRDALSGGGPAVLPGMPSGQLPTEVPQKIAVVVETSGSTGEPKRVALSADALLSSATASASVLGGTGQWLLTLPVHYIAGINVLVRSIAAQTQPVLLGTDRFDVDRFVAVTNTMDSERRFTALVPAQLAAALEVDAATAALRRFDGILLGGQATPPALLERSLGEGLRVVRSYGSSETSGGCVYDGVPIGTTQVRIGDGGRVEIAGGVLAEGYLGDPDLSDRVFVTDSGQRWYLTDDRGELHDGVLRVTGRTDDIIVSGGVKVSLGAVERVVRELPGQEDAVVVAVDDERWGEVPVVVTHRAVPRDLVRSVVKERLGRESAPARIVIVDALPLLSTGKPDRRAIRSLAQ